MITGLTGVNMTAWPNSSTTFPDSSFALMRSWNLDCVSINFGWNFLEPVQGQYDAAYLAVLDDLVAKAKANDLYVILRFIKWAGAGGYQGDYPAWPTAWIVGFPAWLGSTGEPHGSTAAPFWENYLNCWDNYVEMFRMLASRYAGEPHVVCFELLGEPGNEIGTFYGDTAQSWNCNGCRKVMSVLFAPTRLYKQAMDAIHSVAPGKIVIFEGYSGNVFRYSSAGQSPPYVQDLVAEKPDCPNIHAAMTNYKWFQWDWFENQRKFVQETWGIPFTVAEFAPDCAAGALNPSAADIAWIETALQTYTAKDISWQYWGYGPSAAPDRFALIQYPGVQISPLTNNLKAYGKLTPTSSPSPLAALALIGLVLFILVIAR